MNSVAKDNPTMVLSQRIATFKSSNRAVATDMWTDAVGAIVDS